MIILFSDIRGFTRSCEEHPPEEIVTRLNEYFDEMVAAIINEGGVVDKFIGDAVMATFGGLLDLEDPGLSAVKAARQMRHRLEGLNKRWAVGGHRSFDNGIGLHLGEVIQGPIGAEHRKDFTVIGDPVNIASRLEGLTRTTDESILVSDALYTDLPASIRQSCQSQGSFQLKGRTGEVQVWSVPE